MISSPLIELVINKINTCWSVRMQKKVKIRIITVIYACGIDRYIEIEMIIRPIYNSLDYFLAIPHSLIFLFLSFADAVAILRGTKVIFARNNNLMHYTFFMIHFSTHEYTISCTWIFSYKCSIASERRGPFMVTCHNLWWK